MALPKTGSARVDFFGDPRGGNGMLILNQEARFPLFGWVEGVAFVGCRQRVSESAATSR